MVRAALKWARKQGKWRGDLTAVMPELSPGYKPRKGWATPEQLDKLLGDLEPEKLIDENQPLTYQKNIKKTK